MRPLRVLVLVHPTLVPPDDLTGLTEEDTHAIKTEYHVVRTLREIGHNVKVLGVQYELRPIREAVEEWHPHIVFNLLEEFHGITEFDQHVVSYLELLRVPYTGCNPRGLTIARDKALSKKIAAYHRIKAPKFATFPRRRRVRRPRDLDFQLIVKSLTQEASNGISQASVVYSDQERQERVNFVHTRIQSAAIAEEFIGAVAIATARVKHNPRYQEERGIFQQQAELPVELTDRVTRTTRRLNHLLNLTGYARIDYRLRGEGELFFLEANPNPEIAPEEEFASAAQAAGLDYSQLLTKILNLGLRSARA